MDSLHFNIYTSHSRIAKWTPPHFNIYTSDSLHATWTAYISTFTLQIPGMLHGEPTFQHFLFRFPPCYRNSLHFNIFSSDSRHATWRAHISTFSLQISAMLQEQPTFQHLLCRFLHATWKVYI